MQSCVLDLRTSKGNIVLRFFAAALYCSDCCRGWYSITFACRAIQRCFVWCQRLS